MTAVLDRVRTLIAKTTSAHEEEARSCALIACRLILEHKLTIVDSNAKPNVSDDRQHIDPTWKEAWSKYGPRQQEPKVEWYWNSEKEAPPRGQYRVMILAVELSEDNDPMEANAELKILSLNRIITDSFVFHRAVMFRIQMLSQAVGIAPPRLVPNGRFNKPSVEHWIDSICGLEVDIDLSYRKMGNKVWANIQRYLPCEERG